MLLKERKLNRLRGFNYSSEGYYFVTFCTKNRINWFGKIFDKKMILNMCGKIVEQQWLWLQNQYKYVRLDKYVIMPNHIHGILIIEHTHNHLNHNEKIKPLPELIGAFKTTSSKLIHEEGLIEFQWQKSFHDNIIRDEKSLYNIRQYIKNNPLEWESDSYYAST